MNQNDWQENLGCVPDLALDTVITVEFFNGKFCTDYLKEFIFTFTDSGYDIKKWKVALVNEVKRENTSEYTGGSVSYYQVEIEHPTSGGKPYVAECNDIIEALGMNYAEGNAFKAIWRKCAAQHLRKAKTGYQDGLYDAEKVVFFGQRMVIQAKNQNA